MGGRGDRPRINQYIFSRRFITKYSAHGRRRMCGSYDNILSQNGIFIGVLANALGLLCEQRVTRLEPAASRASRTQPR